MAKANKSRYAILGILANAPESSGYDIQSIMKESTDFFWKETFSSIYPVLETLKKEKLIMEIESSPDGRKRKTYKLSKDGIKILQSWLLEDVELEQSRNELLLKVFLGDLNGIDSSIKHIEIYKQRISQRKFILEKAKKALPKKDPINRGLPFWLMALEFGLRRMQASIEWSDYALDTLSKLKKEKKWQNIQ
jgi:DNA-binding PadR family transcriptional regulator